MTSTIELEERLKDLEFRIFDGIRACKDGIENFKNNPTDIRFIDELAEDYSIWLKTFENMKTKVKVMMNKNTNGTFTETDEDELERIEDEIYLFWFGE